MIFQSACEILGIISLFPFLGIILTQEKINFEYLSFLNINENSYIIIFSLILIILNWLTYYIGKNIFIFSENLSKYFSELQIKKYLYSINESHSSNLINNISIETYRFTRMVLIPSLLLISKIVNIIFICIFLLFFSFVPTIIIISSLLVIISIVYSINKEKIKIIGDDITVNNSMRIHTLTEIVNNLPSIRIFKLENYFLNFFSENNKRYADSMAKNQYLILSQRYLVEGIVIVTLIVSLYFISDQIDINDYLPKIAIYLYAFYRIAPHLQSSLNLFTQAKSHSKAGINLMNSIVSKEENEISPPNFPKTFISININNFSYKYGENIIFENTSLTINKGEKILLTGESGSGKSTLLNLLFGSIKFNRIEKLSINSKNYSNELIIYFNEFIGYVPQEVLLFDESLYFNITFKKLSNKKDVLYEKILELAYLNDDIFINDSSDNVYNKRINEKGANLSIGQKQRISLARALYKNPQILILDETFNSIDSKKRNNILKYLNNMKDLTLIIVSHHKLDEIEFSKIINLRNNQLNESFPE